MGVEIPELKKCCCCLPLRRGLLTWIYLKVALEVLVVLYFFLMLMRLLYFREYVGLVDDYITISIGMLIPILDLAFCILFLISAHRKQPDNMRIYYRYAIGVLILGVTCLLIIISFEIYEYFGVIPSHYRLRFLQSMLEVTCAIILPLLIHAYCIILVRSEILKLERGAKFEFTNRTVEPECKVQLTV